MLTTLFHSLNIADLRNDRKKHLQRIEVSKYRKNESLTRMAQVNQRDRTHPILRHSKIMNHSSHRRNQPNYLSKLSIRTDTIIAYIRGTIALRLISEANHLSRLRVELWMGSKGQTGELSLEIIQPFGFQCNGVKSIWGSVFFQSEELPVEVDYVGVGCCADFEFDGVGVFVAVFTCLVSR
jgi:hypothetical protein